MTAPQLTQYANSIASALVADEYNTLLQGCDTFAQLRAFKGVAGMQVYARGATAPGDGGQGFFRWVLGGAVDDASNVLVITGAFPPAYWQRTSTDTVAAPFATVSLSNITAAGQNVISQNTFPPYANLTAYLAVNPTPQTGYSYWDNALVCPRIYGSDAAWHNVALNT